MTRRAAALKRDQRVGDRWLRGKGDRGGSRSANRDSGVCEHEPAGVVRELALEVEARSGVAIALCALPVSKPDGALFEPLDVEVACAHVHRSRIRPPTDVQSEP